VADRIKLASFLLLLSLAGSGIVSSDSSSKTYKGTRKLLWKMHDRRLDSDKLAFLFRIGDKRVIDLIQALDDPDKAISLRAQIVLRYLGNEVGMKALREWYGRQQREYQIAGPVPLPLSDWDYNVIKIEFLSKPPQSWRDRAVQYIYSLALDESPRAKIVLDEMVKRAEKLNESTFVKLAMRHIQARQPAKPLTGQKDLAKLVRDNAFFVATVDQRYMSVRLLGFNAARDKALLEVHVDRGSLDEEWYHVVVSKCGSGWQFFAIDQIAIS
jgi:hypothetical protein